MAKRVRSSGWIWVSCFVLGGCRAIIGYEEGEAVPESAYATSGVLDLDGGVIPGVTSGMPATSGAGQTSGSTSGTDVVGPSGASGASGTTSGASSGSTSGGAGSGASSGSTSGGSGSGQTTGSSGGKSGTTSGATGAQSGQSGATTGATGRSGSSGLTGSSGTSGAVTPPPNLVVPRSWVPLASNSLGIQAVAYSFSDGISSSAIDGDPVYDPAAKAYCIRGETVEDPTWTAWGATIGIDLGAVEGDLTGTLKTAYDWRGKIKGFRIDYTMVGSQDVTITMRVERSVSGGAMDPFIPGKGSGIYLISSASVPATWLVPNAGAIVGNKPLFGIGIQVSGGSIAGPYELCVTSVVPIPI